MADDLDPATVDLGPIRERWLDWFGPMAVTAEPLDLGPIRERWLDWFGPMAVKRNPVWPGRGEDEEEGEYMARLDVPALLAEVDRLREALATARRDVLAEAAERVYDEWPGGTGHEGLGVQWVEDWLRNRAAQEEEENRG